MFFLRTYIIRNTASFSNDIISKTFRRLYKNDYAQKSN